MWIVAAVPQFFLFIIFCCRLVPVPANSEDFAYWWSGIGKGLRLQTFAAGLFTLFLTIIPFLLFSANSKSHFNNSWFIVGTPFMQTKLFLWISCIRGYYSKLNICLGITTKLAQGGGVHFRKSH